MTGQEQRRLAAIMMLDVVGFTRLMGEDESGTLALVLDARRSHVEPALSRHGGRLVKLLGDGALAEFASVTGALDCARDIQTGMRNHPLKLRIGINLGEVIVEEDDIYGDGVNVASRIEGLARPGGIAVSHSVYEQARSRGGYRFVDGGKQMVKNVAEPVAVFHLSADDSQAEAVRPASSPRRRRWLPLALAACVVVAGAVYALLVGDLRLWTDDAPPPVGALVAEDRPSLVVLPFENLSGDPEQTYFSDGMTDNLINDLSQIGGLLVIARNTSFSFRDRQEPMDARTVHKVLGVRYVVEGSVQRAGDHVRINANLVDGTTGFQLWAGRLDREFSDLFALQDQVASQIIDALRIELTQDQQRRLSKRYTDNLKAYDLFLRAWEEVWRFNEESRQIAQEFLWSALAIDPDFALAKAILATTYTNRTGVSLTMNAESLETAYRLAGQAVAIDPELPAVHASLGLVHMFRREFEKADASFARAVELDPNYADGFGMQAWNWHYAGDPERALAGFEYAMRLNPRAPFPYLNAIAEVHFSLGNLEAALEWSTEALERNPEALRQRLLQGAIFAEMGQIEDAEWEVVEALALQPGIRVANLPDIYPYREGETLMRLEQALRSAGLPG
ncbi:adenylate/guanylate cyclase domain-containing protein [Ruegeria sp. WL0004]|uniref:Adenylate/guanylate cyclase domain-containing protein n=1 Tax=Ruegeria marisflavi TaxID=2984152 RepID=A0ABT2WVT7_9RHOB|nr:adenylate/guanylate cyclase domain-containing protein [Ruegeria sp. WL0004]MCU9839827.1 adenylate/guanylate cyclase domain-containing protein [Ruegeria sp. WL0004]